MKKRIATFLLAFAMLLVMPITILGDPGGSGGGPPPTPPPFERSSIFIPPMMVAFDCLDEVQ